MAVMVFYSSYVVLVLQLIDLKGTTHVLFTVFVCSVTYICA